MRGGERSWLEPIPLRTGVPALHGEDAALATVHVYSWGDERLAGSVVELGLGLTRQATSEVLGGGLPISLLCELAQAEAVAAVLTEVGANVAVTPEPGLGVRLLARMAR